MLKNSPVRSYPGNDDSCDRNFDGWSFEEFVSQVNPVPEGNDVTLDGNVVLAMEPEKKLILVYPIRGDLSNQILGEPDR